MTDTLIKTTPNGVAPDGYLHVRTYEWVECDLPAYAGPPPFRAQVMANPTYGEERAEQKLWANVTTPEGEEAWLQHVAHRVRAWNALAEGEDGAVVRIPAPGESSWEAFYAIERTLLAWLMVKVHFLPLGKHRSTSASSEPVELMPVPRPEERDPSDGDSG